MAKTSATVAQISGAIRPQDFDDLTRRYIAARRDVGDHAGELFKAIRRATGERRDLLLTGLAHVVGSLENAATAAHDLAASPSPAPRK